MTLILLHMQMYMYMEKFLRSFNCYFDVANLKTKTKEVTQLYGKKEKKNVIISWIILSLKWTTEQHEFALEKIIFQMERFAISGKAKERRFSCSGSHSSTSTVQKEEKVSPYWATSWENQQCGFWTGPTQTALYKHRKELEAWSFGFK